MGSGKTSIARGLAKVLECPVASFGNYVRDLAGRIGRNSSREALQELSEQLLASIGPRGLTREILDSSSWDRNQSLVVDGIRHPTVVAALRAEVAPLPLILVYLDVPPAVRHERLVGRDNLSANEIEGFDLHSTERDVGTRVRALADIVLTADGQVEETLAAVKNAICSWRRL
jgi:dephospho-CoA kinase